MTGITDWRTDWYSVRQENHRMIKHDDDSRLISAVSLVAGIISLISAALNMVLVVIQILL